MKTACKECKFAQYEGKTQTDCELKILDWFQQRNLVEDCYDDDSEFFVINQLCPFFRPRTWEGGKEEVYEENKFRADLVVQHTNLEDLKLTLATAAQFESVVVINSNSKTPANEIVALLRGQFKKWFVESTSVDSEGRELDLASKRCKANYYVVVKGGTELPTDFCDKVNSYIFERLSSFMALRVPLSKSTAVVYNRHIHKILGGHEDGTIEEKVKKICEETQQTHDNYLLEATL